MSKSDHLKAVLDDAYVNDRFYLPPDLKKELEEQRLAYRFVSTKRVVDGKTVDGWVPYKRKGTPSKATALKFGHSADGYIRRGELVLAVKPKTEHALHKARLKKRNEAISKQLELYKDTFRQSVRGKYIKDVE